VRTLKELDRQIGASMGDISPDSFIINGQLVNVITGEIYQADIAIKDDRIVRVGDISDLISKFSYNIPTINCKDSYILPGLIDTHLHTESTMLPPSAFASLVLPKGTTTVVVDPHEIANVLGIQGLELFVEETNNLPLEFLIEIPSCVPAAPSLETSTHLLSSDDLRPLIEKKEEFFALAEVMNFPGVIYRDPDVLLKLSFSEKNQKIIEGHSPGLHGKDLQAYLTAGISSCHESENPSEAIEKLRLGCKIQLREGSFAKNLVSLTKGIKNSLGLHHPWKHVIIASDDRHVDDLMEKGHLDHSLRLLVNDAGLDPITAIQICTINPAKHLLRPDIGIIAPGKIANIITVKDLTQFDIQDVIAQGQHVAHKNQLLKPIIHPSYPEWALNTVKPKFIPQIDDFSISSPEGYANDKISAHIIGILEHSLFTNHIIRDVPFENGKIVLNEKDDISYFFLLDRYGTTEHFSKALVSGFKFQHQGALATTVAHDSHQLLICGNDSHYMFDAMKTLLESQGGLALVTKDNQDKKLIKTLPLPYAGLMSIEKPTDVAKKFGKIKKMASDLCTGISEPFMALSFMALPVIPKLKLTDKGLVDVDKFKVISLFEFN
jgi:adenine deaminase